MVVDLAIIVLFTLITWGVLQLCILHSDYNVVFVLNVFSSLAFPDVIVVFDWLAKVFLNMVLLVSSLVLIYSYYYIGSAWFTNKFIAILSVFIVSMVILSLSGDVFWMIVGWDGLGVSSFCLIIFYQNWKSVEGGLVTFMCNRFGDLFILISIACMMCDALWLSVGSFSLSSWSTYLLLVVGGITKSAQAPFSAWLPLAIAAPTPVSSLVHSSTLVTAGVFLVCRFISVLSYWCLSVVYLVSGFTILVAGVSSLFEWDLKNVVALSTLVHIGLIINVVSLGSVESCLLHMTIHAFFNSMLFIGAGVIIHSSHNWQDLRRVALGSADSNWPIVWVSLLSIMGVPFLSGFCSNEVIIGYYFEGSNGCIVSIPFWIGVGFTVAYSCRILFYLSSVSLLPFTAGSSGTFCGAVILWGVVLSTVGSYIIWEMSWKSCFMINFIESGSNLFLAMVIITGVAIGLMAVSTTSSIPLLNNMWKSSSFVGIWSGLFYPGSWYMLNRFDVNGGFGLLVSDVYISILNYILLVGHYLLVWPVFLLKISLTIFTTLAVLGVLIN